MQSFVRVAFVSLFLSHFLYAGEKAGSVGLTGTISKNNETEVVGFGFKLGTRGHYYTVSGRTTPDIGVYQSNIDFSSVEVKKKDYVDGKTFERELRTAGEMQVFPRKRKLSGLTIADVKLSGQFIQGAFNDGLFIDDLEVDNKPSKGLLDYNNFVGYYRTKRGARFGEEAIGSSLPASNIFINYDNFIGQNRMRVTMLFGDLDVSGTIFFNDTTRTSTDSDGDSTTTVVATSGDVQLTVKRRDGAPLELNDLGAAEETKDEVSLRRLVAFWSLFAYDMFK